jgi:glycosyltransferase involved in cell wall biosynthesis
VDISVVIPVYNEEGALPAFFPVLAETLDRPPQSAEIVVADDGRPSSRNRLDAIAEGDLRLRALHLSRNHSQTDGRD